MLIFRNLPSNHVCTHTHSHEWKLERYKHLLLSPWNSSDHDMLNCHVIVNIIDLSASRQKWSREKIFLGVSRWWLKVIIKPMYTIHYICQTPYNFYIIFRIPHLECYPRTTIETKSSNFYFIVSQTGFNQQFVVLI